MIADQIEIVMVDGSIRMYGGEHDDVIDLKNHRYLINSRLSSRCLISRSLAAGIAIAERRKYIVGKIPVIGWVNYER